MTFIAPQLNKTVTVPQLLINLTMFQTPLRVENIDGVYWTLWVELTFYLLIAVLILFGANERLFVWFIFIWPLFGLGISLSGISFLAHGLGTRHSSFFAAGMCLYLLHKNGNKFIVWLLFFMNAGIGIGLAMNAPAPGPAGQPVSPLITAIVLLACFAAIAIVTLTPLKFTGGSWMLRAGALTYPLYLVHQYWGWWIIGLVDPIAGKWIAVLVAIAFVLLLAYCIERWIERPLRPRLRNLVSRQGFGSDARVGDVLT